MRLTNLTLENFRRFDRLELAPLDRDLTIIVGPNGAGKSTLAHALRLITLALRWAGAFDSDAFAQLQTYSAALHHGTRSKTFAVRVGVEFSGEREITLWRDFVRAIVASAVVERHPPVGAPALDQLLASVTAESIRDLLNGHLVVTYSAGLTSSWMVGYEFIHGTQPFYLGLQGGVQAGHILQGRVPSEPPPGLRGVDLATRVADVAENGMAFSLDLLLPSGEEGVTAQVKGTSGFRSPAIEDFLSSIGAEPSAGRDPSAASILHQIVTTSLALISDQRLPPQMLYPVGELARHPSLIDGAKVPLELYRLKNGDLAERRRYEQLKVLFKTLTGKSTEIHSRPSDDSGATMLIEPTIIEGSWEVPVSLAGAGLWEALILATVLCGEAGMMVVLDEPAVNLSPTLQRRLSDQLARQDGTQVLLITHSPYLVPMTKIADLGRIARISTGVSEEGTSTIRRLLDVSSGDTTVPGLGAHWRQLLAGRADVRSALFAAGVILVEGETELGAFDQWFRQAEAKGKKLPTPDSLNLLLLPVGGDGLFGQYVAYLEACGVPWAIVCDGPVLSPNYQNGTPLIKQLHGIIPLESQSWPADPLAFTEWKQFWRSRRVWTLASTFGGVEKGSKNKSGEVEAFFESKDSSRWAKVKGTYDKSKVRAGHAFAEAVPCPTEVSEMYEWLVEKLTS